MVSGVMLSPEACLCWKQLVALTPTPATPLFRVAHRRWDCLCLGDEGARQFNHLLYFL